MPPQKWSAVVTLIGAAAFDPQLDYPERLILAFVRIKLLDKLHLDRVAGVDQYVFSGNKAREGSISSQSFWIAGSDCPPQWASKIAAESGVSPSPSGVLGIVFN